jgi:hypothetical protein
VWRGRFHSSELDCSINGRSDPGNALRTLLVALLVWFPALSPALAQTATRPLLPESICGFINNYKYGEAQQVKRGLAVDLFVGDAQVNRPVKLRFYVNLKPADVPVEDLQVEHDRIIHVIGVRDDLGEFFHIHPEKVSPGMWVVAHTFTHGGTYKIWSDVKYHTTSYAFGQPLLTVSGSMGDAQENRAVKDRVVASGYEVTLSHTEPLIVGKTNVLQFAIRDSAGNLVKTERFLGAPMHMVLIKDDLSVYLHAHPEDGHAVAPTDPIVRFRQLFTQPGLYKLFAQFRPKDTKLPSDDAILAQFYLKVAADEGTAVRAAAK